MPKSFDVRIVDVDVAHEGKNLRRVTNEEIVRILEENRVQLRKWFNLETFPEWWRKDPIAAPHRERHEAKFFQKHGRMPNINHPKERAALLEEFVFGDTETSDEWIEAHTGIKSRFFAKPGVATSDLAVEAADNVLAAAGVHAHEVRGIFIATVTPDHNQTPPMAAIVSAKLGMSGNSNSHLSDMPFIDGTAACSSFVVVLRAACAIARSEGGLYLVIGVDVMSRTVNPFSRNILPILGDGAGAILLEARETNGEHTDESNFRPECFFSYLDGSKAHLIVTPAGGSRLSVTAEMIKNPFDQRHLMFMDGPKVRKEAVRLIVPSRLEDIPKTVLPAAFVKMGLPMDTEEDFMNALAQVDVFLFHQANARIIEDMESKVRKFKYQGLVFNNIRDNGNTTSASIPLLLEEGWRRGIIKRGTRVMAVVFGGGLTAATAYFRF